MCSKLKFLFFSIFFVLVTSQLAGCDMVLFQPKGAIAAEQIRLIVIALILMLLIVVPVIIMTIVFAWRYRASNTKATYAPNWAHNSKLEIVWWTIPCIIIIALAWITWVTSHTLDPYKPLDSKVKPLTVQAVSLNWKWLFIYPEQHIATVNYLQLPDKTPINLQISSDGPMNSLWIPALGGQIYAMAGMRTKLHLIADGTGRYDGLSASFSGDGFSDMHFNVDTVSADDFAQWVQTVQSKSTPMLDFNYYQQLAVPSMNDPVSYYATVSDGLFNRVMMKFMMPESAMIGMDDAQFEHMDMAMMMNGG